MNTETETDVMGFRTIYGATSYEIYEIARREVERKRQNAAKRRLRILLFGTALVVACAGSWYAAAAEVSPQTFGLMALGAVFAWCGGLFVVQLIGKRPTTLEESCERDIGTGGKRNHAPHYGGGLMRQEKCSSSFCHENDGLRDGDTVVCCGDGDSAVDGGGMMCTKPVIYLYPQSSIKCSVFVRFDGELTCTYPTHGADGWRDFVAAPDGTLTFPDGRKFYCLYWEGTTPTRWDFSKGYCVRGSETREFLADILAKMGLSFREANEFIIYWLPKMQKNPYNVIAFQGERYSKSAKLEIEPQPDSVLRVFMAWKASDCPVDIPAPEIKSFERKGFTVVEWGGTEVGK